MCLHSLNWCYHDHPCTNPGNYLSSYTYCQFSTYDPTTGQRYPCAALVQDNTTETQWILNHECGDGQCRLEELGNRWRCCQCSFGGNQGRRCKRRQMDTFCYHKVCQSCTADTGRDRR